MARRYGSAAVDDSAPKIQPKNDVYTGLLVVSLVGMIISCVLLGLDWVQYPGTREEPKVQQVPNLPGVGEAKDKAKDKGK